MRRQEIDHILTKMLDAHKRVSDLNITVGKPFQVESDRQAPYGRACQEWLLRPVI